MVRDDKKQPALNVTVYLNAANDSSLVKMNLSNKEGVYEFDGIAAGKYF